ncbi:phosphonate ABC transporter, periplasmic phosphonate-binding protein [Phenylobacterium zucineum HLK1]|uniref:Phosphonate ABC transporter, periplasmic phosphonate-binding protein n=1 Tax=Phenylobacterium zucineum (strain HLK1) TaxID=450851 RepID=B4RB81_PHEZH|nr:phosphate/phosphite/phosphonate ABC transporter substrate-binding protein [Phenylobacterium zucineum]ACG79726.1 phosphonate ABC transporter, periplasmic phosphonate-binding protein [Phenylobacterium zucineum HLK1]
MIRRRILGLALIAATLGLAACGDGGETAASGGTPKELNFAITPAEGQQSMQPLWQPLLDDMSRQIGVKVKPYFISNYTSMIEAMRFNQAQVGWFSALPALEATRRADGEVIGRVVDASGEGSYQSVLIVRKGSGVTLEDVLKCDRTLALGIGDAKSTTGTLAPKAYLFTPNNIDPAKCFKAVRAANHQSNFMAVANGLTDVATNNTIGLQFYERDNPELFQRIEIIWRSPPIPESSILVRKDLDPAVKEKIRQFFLTYGTGTDEVAEKQRKVLEGLKYGGFRPADNSYLDPIREMEAAEALADARRSGDAGRIRKAQAEFDKVRADAAQKRAREPAV